MPLHPGPHSSWYLKAERIKCLLLCDADRNEAERQYRFELFETLKNNLYIYKQDANTKGADIPLNYRDCSTFNGGNSNQYETTITFYKTTVYFWLNKSEYFSTTISSK